jgi:hypothetical protein
VKLLQPLLEAFHRTLGLDVATASIGAEQSVKPDGNDAQRRMEELFRENVNLKTQLVWPSVSVSVTHGLDYARCQWREEQRGSRHDRRVILEPLSSIYFCIRLWCVFIP